LRKPLNEEAASRGGCAAPLWGGLHPREPMPNRARSSALLAALVATASLLPALAPGAAAASANSWTAASSLEADAFNATQASVAVGPDGSALFVWQQLTNTTPYIAANLYTPGSGWSGPTNISWGLAANNPRVAAAGLGRFVVAWTGNNNVSANWFTQGAGWGGPSTIVAPGASISSLALDADENGRAALAWSTTNFPPRIQVSLYSPGLGWSSPTLLTSLFAANTVAVAVSGTGGAAVAWREANMTASRVVSSTFNPGWGWTATASVSGNLPAAAYADLYPAIAMSANGTALAIARGQFGNPYITNRYVPGSGWGVPGGISPIFGGVVFNPPVLRIDGAGNGVVGVTEALTNGSFAAELYSFDAASLNWRNLLVPNTGSPAGNTAASVDSAGRLLLAWAEDTGSGFMARATRYMASSGWETPTDLGPSWDVALNQSVRLAVDVGASGDGAVAWLDFPAGGNADAWGAVFARDTEAPSLAVTSPSPGATNQSLFTVTGTTDPSAMVTIDGAPAIIDGAGAFAESIALADGPHTFVIVAWDAEGNRVEVRVDVLVDTIAPALSVTNPAGGEMFATPIAVVSGDAEPGATVTVNGLQVPVSPAGDFATIAALVEGQNTVTVAARDAAGNTVSLARTVTYTNAYAAQLAQSELALGVAVAALNAANASAAVANAALASASASLTVAAANLATAQADLSSAEQALATAVADMNATDAELAAARADYATAQASLTSAEERANRSASELDDAKAVYAAAVARADQLSLQVNETAAAVAAANDKALQAQADAAAARAQAASAGGTGTIALLLGLVAAGIGALALTRGRRPQAPEPAEAPARSRRSEGSEGKGSSKGEGGAKDKAK